MSLNPSRNTTMRKTLKHHYTDNRKNEFPKLQLTQTISTEVNEFNNQYTNSKSKGKSKETHNHFYNSNSSKFNPMSMSLRAGLIRKDSFPTQSKHATFNLNSIAQSRKDSSNDNTILINEIKKLDLWDKEHIENVNLNKLFNHLTRKCKRNASSTRILTIAQRASLTSKLSSKLDITKLKNSFVKKEITHNNAPLSLAKKYKSNQAFNFAPFFANANKSNKNEDDVSQQKNQNDINQTEKPEIVRNIIREKVKSENYIRGEIMEILHNIIINKIEKKKYEEILDELYRSLQNVRLEYSLQVDMLTEQTRSVSRQYDQVSQNFTITANRNRRKSILSPLKNGNGPTEDEKKAALQVEEKMKLILYAKGQVAKYDECKSGYLKSYTKLKLEFENQIKECKETISRLTEEERYLKLIYRNINKEQCDYYLDILKTGIDCRSEGLIWVIRRLNELSAFLDYHMFPNFLDNDQINYLLQMSKLTAERTQYKLMLKTLRIRQQKLKEEQNDKAMIQFNTKTKQDHIKSIISKRFNPEIFSKETLSKFEDIYRKHESIVKQTFDTAFEDIHINEIIQEIKNQLIEDSSLNSNKNKTSYILQLLMQDEKQKEYFQELMKLKAKLTELDLIIEELNKQQQLKYKIRYSKGNNDAQSMELSSKVYSALFGTQLTM